MLPGLPGGAQSLIGDTGLHADTHAIVLDPSTLSDDERDLFDQSCPFDRFQRITWGDAVNNSFFQQHYGFIEHAADAWRRIVDDPARRGRRGV